MEDVTSSFDSLPVRDVLEAGFIIFRRKSIKSPVEYLLLQSASGRETWGPPKGHLEEGETNEQNAWRELKEETGLDETNVMVLDDFNHVIKYTKNDKKKEAGKKMMIVRLWLAELSHIDQEIEISEEHQDSKWAALTEVKQLLASRGGSNEWIEYFEKCEKRIEKQATKT